MKIPLNSSRSSRERYYLISGGMGQHGMPADAPDHKYSVVNGIYRGHGYQGYMSCHYALNKCQHLSREVKSRLRTQLRALGYKIDKEVA